MAREGQGYPCYQHDMMMMMIYIGERLCGVVANVLDNDILENAFELQCLIFNFVNNWRELAAFLHVLTMSYVDLVLERHSLRAYGVSIAFVSSVMGSS